MIDETKRHVIVVVNYQDRSVLGLYEDGDVWTLKDSHTDRTAGQLRQVAIPSDWPRADYVMFGFGGAEALFDRPPIESAPVAAGEQG